MNDSRSEIANFDDDSEGSGAAFWACVILGFGCLAALGYVLL